MKILLTGATGLIGTELTKTLTNQGFKINYLSTSKNKIKKNENIEGFYWNPKTGDIDTRCLDEVDAIIHLAGANIANRWTKSYKKEILESRVLSTQLLYKTLKLNNHQVQHFVAASGTAIYPNSSHKIATEDAVDFSNEFLSSVVQEWEKSVTQINTLGIKVCQLRTGVVYASSSGALQEIIKPIKLGIGSSFGTGTQIHSWIHITDLVEMYLFSVVNKLEGVYNAVAPKPVSDMELTKNIAKILHRPLFLPNIPRFLMKFILGDMHELLFEDKNISSKKIENQGFVFKYPKIEPALNEILTKKMKQKLLD